MDWDVQRRTVFWPYTAFGFPNSDGYLRPATVGDFNVNPTLLFRKIWACVFSVPDADSYTQYRSQILVTTAGTEKPLLSWTTRNNQGFADVPGNSSTSDNDAFLRMAPPFAVMQDGFGDNDKGPLPACGPDARVMSFQAGSKSSAQSARPIYRCTMFPIRLTTACTRIRLIVSDFAPQNSNPYSLVSGNTGSSLTGYVAAAIMVQSQLRPE